VASTNDTSFAFRLLPGSDLKNVIMQVVKEHDIAAGWIASCVGSIRSYSIRFANQPIASCGSGFYEIVSLSGTVSVNGLHLHICISDERGKTIGGHLAEGCEIYTTAEIILIASGNYHFAREMDGSTAWKELQVSKKK
jgi:uncharacterized protein